MKKHNGWAYAPYQPVFLKTDIYICRIVPTMDSFAFDWLDIGAEQYDVFFKKTTEEEFTSYGSVKGCHCEITGLETDTDYDFYVSAGEKKKCGTQGPPRQSQRHPRQLSASR